MILVLVLSLNKLLRENVVVPTARHLQGGFMLFNFVVEFSQVASGQNITHPRSIQQSSGGSAVQPPRLDLKLDNYK